MVMWSYIFHDWRWLISNKTWSIETNSIRNHRLILKRKIDSVTEQVTNSVSYACDQNSKDQQSSYVDFI